MANVNSPTKAPTAKVAAATLATAIAGLICYAAQHQLGWNLDQDSVVLIVTAILTVAAGVAGYLKKPRLEDVAKVTVAVQAQDGIATALAHLDGEELDDDSLPPDAGEAASL